MSGTRRPNGGDGLFDFEAEGDATSGAVPADAFPTDPYEPGDAPIEPQPEAALAVSQAPQAPMAPQAPILVEPVDGSRLASLRVATLHLRMGQHALARAELEAFAGRGLLDEQALLDLAEVRWRSGDLIGAGEAAVAMLARGVDSPLALVIAAESMAAAGRVSDGRGLADRAVALVGDDLGALFAGLPSARIWPHSEAQGAETAAAHDDDDLDRGDSQVAAPEPAVRAGWQILSSSEADVVKAAPAPEPRPAPEPIAPAPEPVAPAPEPVDPTPVPRPAPEPVAPAPNPEPEQAPEPQPEPRDLRAFVDGVSFLRAGDQRKAALLLGLALRLDPTCAADVVGLLDGGPLDPGLAIVEGDALRLMGRESDALIAYDRARGPALESGWHEDPRRDD